MSDEKRKTTGRNQVTRREFIKRTTAITAGAVAFPMIVPSSALGLGDSVAPSNRINMGCIGVGSQGTGNLRGFLNNKNMHFVAVADVEVKHRDRAKNMIDQRNENTDCATYNDFRDMLERVDNVEQIPKEIGTAGLRFGRGDGRGGDDHPRWHRRGRGDRSDCQSAALAAPSVRESDAGRADRAAAGCPGGALPIQARHRAPGGR